MRAVPRTTAASVGSETWDVEIPSCGDLKEECYRKDDAAETVEVLHLKDFLRRLSVNPTNSTQ